MFPDITYLLIIRNPNDDTLFKFSFHPSNSLICTRYCWFCSLRRPHRFPRRMSSTTRPPHAAGKQTAVGRFVDVPCKFGDREFICRAHKHKLADK